MANYQLRNRKYYSTRCISPEVISGSRLQLGIRASLQTKERKVAISRNLAMAAHLRELIAQIDTRTDTSPRSFQKWICNEEEGLRCIQKRKFKATTNTNHTLPVADNLLM